MNFVPPTSQLIIMSWRLISLMETFVYGVVAIIMFGIWCWRSRLSGIWVLLGKSDFFFFFCHLWFWIFIIVIIVLVSSKQWIWISQLEEALRVATKQAQEDECKNWKKQEEHTNCKDCNENKEIKIDSQMIEIYRIKLFFFVDFQIFWR